MKKKTITIAFALSISLIAASCSLNQTESGEKTIEYREKNVVVWKNEDGQILQKNNYLFVDDNNLESYSSYYIGPTPEKARTPQYTYKFSGWDGKRENDGSVVYTAKYESVLNSYTIRWVNWDGRVLETDYDVPYGTMPSYDSPTPIRDRNDEYTYTFSSWSPSLSMVVDDATYQATYSYETNIYQIALDPAGGTVSWSQNTIVYGSEYNLPTPTKTGYTFDGWYDKDTKVNSSGTWRFGTDKTFIAHWVATKYTITYILNGGTNSSYNPSTYTIENAVTLRNPSKSGYTFDGWYNGDTRVDTIPKGSTGNITLTATWTIISYTITYNLDGGTNSANNPATYTVDTTTITLADPIREGYTFNGWYLNKYGSTYSNKITQIAKGSTGNKTLYAKWTIITYTITYNLDGGQNNPNNPTSYTVEDEIVLYSAQNKPGHSFVGWKKANDYISTISKGTTGNISLTAVWNIESYSVLLTTDETKGSVSGSGVYLYNSTVVVEAVPKSGYKFAGWYVDEEYKVRVSSSERYEFTLSDSSIHLFAKFWTEEEDEVWNINHGVKPSINSSGTTVTFGLYPKNYVSDDNLVTILDNLEYSCQGTDDWYCYNDEFYKKIKVDQDVEWYEDLLNTSYSNYTPRTFDDGVKLTKSSYWFKCEPITWNVFSKDGNKYFLATRDIVDGHSYVKCDESNDYDPRGENPAYETSDMRNWLTTSFFNSAFALNQAPIETTNVDNSSGTYTYDKVFLLSSNEVTSHSSYKIAYTTDFSRANGVNDIRRGTNIHRGCYYTRSYTGRKPDGVYLVNTGGTVGRYYYDDYYSARTDGVRPGITIAI